MQMQPVDLLVPTAPTKGAGGAGAGDAIKPFNAVQEQANKDQARPTNGEEKDTLHADVPPDSPQDPLQDSSPPREKPDEMAETAAETMVAPPQQTGDEAPVAEPKVAQSPGLTGKIVAPEVPIQEAVLTSTSSNPSLEKALTPPSGPTPETTAAEIPGQPAPGLAQAQVKASENAAAALAAAPANFNHAKGVSENAAAQAVAQANQANQANQVNQVKGIPAALKAEIATQEQQVQTLSDPFHLAETAQGERTLTAAMPNEIVKGTSKDSADSTTMGKMFSELIGNTRAQGSMRQENHGPVIQTQEAPVASFLNSGESGRITLEEAILGTTGTQTTSTPNPFAEVLGQGQPQGISATFVPQGTEAQPQPAMMTASPFNQNLDAATTIRLPSGTMVSEAHVLNEVIENMAVRIGPLKRSNSIMIRMNPEELGQLKIALEVTQEGVRAHLFAQTQQSQEILERNLPKLREALEQQGLKLDDIQVDISSDQNAGSRSFFEGQRESNFRHTAGTSPLSSLQEEEQIEPLARPAGIMDQGGLSMHV